MSRKVYFFWASYADLMTSLFFIMLVLFILTVVILKRQQEGLLNDLNRLKKILKLEQQFAPLQENSKFYYLSECNKYIVKDLMGIEIFDPNDVIIKKEFIPRTIQAGKIIESFLKKLNTENQGFTYLLVIEGNMANKWDQSINLNSNFGYLTSYKRALAVYNLWLQNNINFRRYNVEVLLCGSGFNGLCRDSLEDNNKRFSIQIIPKVSNK
jgi:hypothetical protein